MLPDGRALVLLALGLVASGCGPRLECGRKCVDVPYARPHPGDADSVFIDHANLLLARREWTAARQLAMAKLARAPNHVGARVVLAAVAWATGDVGESNRLLREARVVDAADFGASVMLARNLQAQGRYAESLAVLEPIASSNADDFELQILQLAAHYATLDAEQGQMIAAAVLASPPWEDHPGYAAALGRAAFLRTLASEPSLVEITGTRAELELELHPPSGGMRSFAVIGGERRPVLISFNHSEAWIDAELAASLGLAELGQVQLAGREPRALALLPELALDDLRISRVPVMVEDLEPWALGDAAHEVDLVLGWQVLGRFGAIVIDPPQQRLRLEVATPIGPPTGAVERPLLLLDPWYLRVPVTPIAIDGSRREFWAWLGFVGVGALTIEQAPYLAAGHTLAEFAGTDEIETGREMVYVDEVALGNLRVGGVGAIVHLDEPGDPWLTSSEALSGFPIDGSINAGLLEQLRITWLPSRGAIWIELSDRDRWLP